MLHHDEHRRDLVGEHVGVGGGGEPLARHRHDVQALEGGHGQLEGEEVQYLGQLVEEVRVAGFHLVPAQMDLQRDGTDKWLPFCCQSI